MPPVTPVSPDSAAALPHFLRPPYPSVFTLEVTERCQHQCAGCGNVFAHASAEMTAAVWAGILERLRPYVQALRVTGGEPTLHRQFSELLKIIDGSGVPFVLFTNGHWANPERILAALSACQYLRGILVSWHGADAESYRRFVGVEAYTVVTRAIQQAAEAGLRVATNTLLLTTTYQNIPEIVDRSLALGASSVCFGRYYGAPLPGLSLREDQLRAALCLIAETHRQDPRVVLSNCVPACFMPEVDFGERGCTSGFTHCTIGPRGEVRPCTHTPVVLGDIRQADVADLWRSTRLNEWRQRMPTECRLCAAFSRCRGGCRATAQACELPHDPLMTRPLDRLAAVPAVELALSDRPRLLGTVQETPYGGAIVGMGKYVTLSAQGCAVAQRLEGRVTIAELQKRFGPAAVELVGSLVQRRLVELE